MIDLSSEIAKSLTAYTNEVEETLVDAQEKITKDGAKRLKSTSPKDTGAYAKGWRVKNTKDGYILYNKTNYQLTHLLEKGHAKVGGGRVAGIPHIGPTEKDMNKEYVETVERELS